MEGDAGPDPLRDHWLLQRIFSNLTLPELKAARLACRHWGEEGVLNYRHRALSIHLNPPHMTQESRMTKLNLEFQRGRVGERKDLRDFLIGSKLSHTLHLSLLDFHPWLQNTLPFKDHCDEFGDFLIGDPFFDQENDLNFGASLLANYLPNVAPFIKELRLELMLRRRQDFKLLEKILEAVEQFVEKLSLDIIFLNDQLLPRMELRNQHQSSKVTTLSIRLLRNYSGEHNGPVSDPLKLLSLFPNLSFLDLVSWRAMEYLNEKNCQKISKYLTTATALDLKLDGIHVAPRRNADYEAILNYTRRKPLKYLYINVCWKVAERSAMIRALEGIIGECGPSLERFDLTWRFWDVGPCPLLGLPTLKKIKSLTYASKFLGRQEPDRTTRLFEEERLSECFGFGELFADSGRMLHFKFPALESLSLILVEPGDGELWEEIFPPENDGNCISKRIKTLVLTFAGECESEEIQKFPRTLFPKLRHFRHGKWAEDGNKLFVCNHEYDPEGTLTRKWTWLAAVKKFMGFESGPIGERTITDDIRDFSNYFYTIREKFRVGLGDHGFWDTGFDIERKGLQYSEQKGAEG